MTEDEALVDAASSEDQDVEGEVSTFSWGVKVEVGAASAVDVVGSAAAEDHVCCSWSALEVGAAPSMLALTDESTPASGVHRDSRSLKD